MGDIEGKTERQGRKEIREGGKRDSSPQLSGQHFPVPLLSLPHPGFLQDTALCWTGAANSAATLLLGREEELGNG